MCFQVKFDPNSTMPYGTWFCPRCGVLAYGGGEFPHNDGCELMDRYDRLAYRYVKRELDALEQGELLGASPLGLLQAYKAAAGGSR